MNLSDRHVAGPDVLARQVGDELVLLDLPSGTYFSVNAVGAQAWELLKTGASGTEICDAVMQRFDVDRATVEADMAGLLTDLVGRGLILPA